MKVELLSLISETNERILEVNCLSRECWRKGDENGSNYWMGFKNALSDIYDDLRGLLDKE